MVILTRALMVRVMIAVMDTHLLAQLNANAIDEKVITLFLGTADNCKGLLYDDNQNKQQVKLSGTPSSSIWITPQGWLRIVYFRVSFLNHSFKLISSCTFLSYVRRLP